jgi:hypothetical protein
MNLSILANLPQIPEQAMVVWLSLKKIIAENLDDLRRQIRKNGERFFGPEEHEESGDINNLRSPFGDLRRFSVLTDQDLLSCRSTCYIQVIHVFHTLCQCDTQ